VLVIGSGGREHALVWRLAQEGQHELWCGPGNAGTAMLGHNVDVTVTDLDGLLRTAQSLRADLTIVGPEAPLAAGIVDRFIDDGLPIFGPTRAAAQLESSKVWAKDFLLRHNIPTARADVATDESSARRLLARTGLPAVIKADGLASGKGVWVVSSPAEVDAALDILFRRRLLGDAANRVLIEQRLTGRELSVLAFVDGERVAVMPPVRDYKRLLDDDAGPNTGGMGGYTRPADATPDLLTQVERDILRPTVSGMAAEGNPYRGVLYAGLMLTHQGPKVLEFNCRFGDPEAQVILPLLRTSLVDVCCATSQSTLARVPVEWRSSINCGVVVAAPGYPDNPSLGAPIDGLDAVSYGVQVFHAGTRTVDGRVVTAGGRVLALVAEAGTLAAARAAVYEQMSRVHFEGGHYRTDIGRHDA
jgi:phosphoribosylamine--glycine ligase